MVTLAHGVALIMLAWLAALAAVVIGKAVFGSGRSEGLLHTVRGEDGEPTVDPERAQLLAVFLGAAGFYFLNGIHVAAAGPVVRLPEVPELLTLALTGSNVIYLSGKLYRS